MQSTTVTGTAFQLAVTSLTSLRESVEQEMASGDWRSESHADTEAPGFMTLVIADVAAVEVLARADVRFAVAATATARAAYEVAVTCAWMLAPNDLAERDRRWMALFLDERRFWRRMVDEAQERNDEQSIIDGLSAEVQRVQALVDAVEPQLANLGKLEGLPIMDVRLEEVEQQKHYVTYKAACQLVHPTTRMLAQVRDLQAAHSDQPPIAQYHFRTRHHDWTIALALSAEALAFGLETLCMRTTPGRPMSAEVVNRFNAVSSALRRLSG